MFMYNAIAETFVTVNCPVTEMFIEVHIKLNFRINYHNFFFSLEQQQTIPTVYISL